MQKIKRILRLFIIVVVFSQIISLSISNAENIEKSKAVNNAQSAVEKAITLTKFKEKSSERNNIETRQAELIVFNDSTTPFLGEYSTNRKVWLIKFEEVQLSKFHESNSDNSRNFEIYIDSIGGKLLKIECQYGTKDLTLCPILDKISAEKQISDGGHQYLDIPEERPKIDFYAALLACPYNPLSAKEILGQYVYFSYGNRPPRPVWIITLVGIPPIKLFGPNSDWIPEYQLNRVRQIIDAETGKAILTSTVPGVPLKPEDKARLFPDLDG